MQKTYVLFTKLKEGAIAPKRQTEGASGMDIFACIEEDLIIESRSFKKIPTGIAIEIPVGYEGQIRARSGLASKYGITILNSPGTIDSDYRGELCVLLINHGKDDYIVKNGDRIAQLVICRYLNVELREADSLSETKRNTGGWGHTGI